MPGLGIIEMNEVIRVFMAFAAVPQRMMVTASRSRRTASTAFSTVIWTL
jgi:hypothetical protein